MKLLRLFVISACGGLLAGCAASIPPAELVDARQAYQHASGLATDLAPGELYNARAALADAEESFRENPASIRTRDLAYVAERKARLAEVLAASAARKSVTIDAKSDYAATLIAIQTNKLLVEARRREVAKVELKNLPESKPTGPATKVNGRTLKHPTQNSERRPAVASPPTVREARQRLGSRAKSPGKMRTARILLFDGDRDRRDSVRTILKSTDYEVVDAVDSEDAIHLIGNGMFDLILLGYALPSPSSVRVLESLKRYQLTTRVIVIKDVPVLATAVRSATLSARGYSPIP